MIDEEQLRNYLNEITDKLRMLGGQLEEHQHNDKGEAVETICLDTYMETSLSRIFEVKKDAKPSE